MIENKTITITKKNKFDKGWAVVKSFKYGFGINRHFCSMSVSSLVRAITYSNEVNLILSDACLSTQIVKELEWANKYIKISVVAKTQTILNRYSTLKFSSSRIENDVDFNYIAIVGKVSVFAIISSDYVETDDTLYRIYFKGEKQECEYRFFDNACSVFFVDKNNEKDYSSLIEKCLKDGISVHYLVGVKSFNRELVHKFKNNNVNLLCSQQLQNGIVYGTSDNRFYCVHLVAKGVPISIEIESVAYYIGQPYESLKLADEIGTDHIPQDSYTCVNGVVAPLDIKTNKQIERTVNIPSMADFVAAEFDKSEIDRHNDYSAEVKTVTYSYTLIPPIFCTADYSKIYERPKAIFSEWKKTFNAPLDRMIADLKALGLEASSLSRVCEEMIRFDSSLSNIVKSYKYRDFYGELDAFSQLIVEAKTNIVTYCEELFSKVNTENLDTKFSKIDVEIAGYQKTIEDKKALIAEGVMVLSNKQRVESLEKKVAELRALKEKFIDSASAKNTKHVQEFLYQCEIIIEKGLVEQTTETETDSIGDVLMQREETKLEKLDLFVKKYLYNFNIFILNLERILNEFKTVDVPTDYLVYEQNGRNVIAIDCEQEFFDTQELQKHYNIECLARR